MSLTRVQCVVLDCDDCDTPFEGEDVGTPHFTTEAEAIDYARRSEWVIVGESMRCRECARKADCAATDHQYGEWMEHVKPMPYRSRWCEHCNATDYDPPCEELSLLMHAANELDGGVW